MAEIQPVQSPSQKPSRGPTPGRGGKRLSAGKIIGFGLLLLLLLGLFWIGRTGLVPGLSKVVGAASPRDLGVRSTVEESRAVRERLGFTMNNRPEATDISAYKKVYAGQIQVDQEFTQSELSALLNFERVSWWAVKDVQIKIHDDGTLETSLNLSTAFIPWDQVPVSILRQLPEKLPAQVPIYVKARLDAVGPQEFKVDVDRMEVGRVAVPESLLGSEAQQGLTDLVNARAAGIPGFSVESLTYSEGKVRFKGTYPQSFDRVPISP